MICLKITSLKDKLKRWEEIQDKISENQKIDAQLIKADLRLEELEREKMRINNLITNNQATISSYQEKIENNNRWIHARSMIALKMQNCFMEHRRH